MALLPMLDDLLDDETDRALSFACASGLTRTERHWRPQWTRSHRSTPPTPAAWRGTTSTRSSPSTRASKGRPRRTYFERRLAAAVREPELHMQFAIDDDGGLAGYMLGPRDGGRVRAGGARRSGSRRSACAPTRRDATSADACSTRSSAIARQARHPRAAHGRALEQPRDAALARRARLRARAQPRRRARDRRRPRSSAPADAPVPSRPGAVRAARSTTARPGTTTTSASRATPATCARCDPRDLAEIVRIDRAITGRDRSAYIGRKLAEAMTESGVRVSLAARLDGADRRLRDGARGPRRLRPHRPDRGARHDRRGPRVRAPGHRPRAPVAAVPEPRRRCASSASRRSWHRATSRCSGFLYDVGFVPSQRIAFVRALK